MQSTRNNSISKTILAIITIFFVTAILAEPSLLIGYRTTAQVHSGGNIQFASHNPPPFEILDISPLTKPPLTPTPTPVPTSRGLMYRNPNNPHRWMLDGKPFHPIGFGDCVYVRGANNAILMGFDGEQSLNFTDLDTYFKAYSDAGFNFLRISVGNCSFPLDLMSENWALMDAYIGKARQYGFQIQFCFFNTNPDTNQLEYVKKCVQRYGKDIAIWEVCNETTVSDASDAAVSVVANFVKSIDAKKRPVTVSHHPNQYPYLRDIPALDLISPHWYQEDDSEFSLDKDIVDRFVYLKAWGKPVIAGEYGLSSANWSQVSALQMRLASWSAFFNEVGLCFWNTSWDKNLKQEGNSNIYLGKQERSFIKVLSDFTKQVPGNVKIANIMVNKPDSVRAYALSSGNGYFAYLHAFTNHRSQTNGISITIESKTAGYATWIESSTGRVLATGKVSAGRQTLPVPPFLIDVALKVSSSPSVKK
jgi:hypothetical protein